MECPETFYTMGREKYTKIWNFKIIFNFHTTVLFVCDQFSKILHSFNKIYKDMIWKDFFPYGTKKQK